MMTFDDEDDEDDEMIVVLTIFTAAIWYNSVRNRSKLTISAILQPSMSPWQHLYANGDDTSFLEMTGFDRESFARLENCLFEEDLGERRAGHPCSLDNCRKLGLYLFYVGSQMKTKHLCLLFGIIPTTADIVIRAMMILLCKKSKNNASAKISFPDDDKMA